tara:strand:+ start:23050 stop:23703 length:654 start_codon:yes stop_codon:yes gene_type:complete
MKTKYLYVIFSFLVCFALITPTMSSAQTDEQSDDVQSLGDILNPKVDGEDRAVTAKDMANIYYKKCMDKESLAFDDDEKEILCACTSANMAEVLKVSEFNNLYENNNKGRDARGKVIAYAYTACMGYVMEQKLYKDCVVSPIVRTLIAGKKSVCECSAKQYVDVINKDASYIIMQSLKHDPMTLNPLEHFFTTSNYGNTANKYIENCRYHMLYKKQN